jgi:hypothetical protein
MIGACHAHALEKMASVGKLCSVARGPTQAAIRPGMTVPISMLLRVDEAIE